MGRAAPVPHATARKNRLGRKHNKTAFNMALFDHAGSSNSRLKPDSIITSLFIKHYLRQEEGK